MATTANLGITHLEPAQAQPHIPVNEAMDNFDKAIAGRFAIDVSAGGTFALTGAQSTNHMINPYGAPGATFTITVQAVNKSWIVINDASQDCTIKTAAGAGVVVKAGRHAYCYCDGANVHYALGPQRASASQAAVAGAAGAAYTGTEQTIINNLITLVNELRAVLVQAGLAKGSA